MQQIFIIIKIIFIGLFFQNKIWKNQGKFGNMNTREEIRKIAMEAPIQMGNQNTTVKKNMMKC